MLTIPAILTKHTTYEPLSESVGNRVYGHDTVDLTAADLTDEMLAAVLDAAQTVAADVERHKPSAITEAKRAARVVEAIQSARAGEFNKSVPSLAAFPEVLLAYLRANLTDGWLYKRGADGHLHPWLVTGVTYDAGNPARDQRPSVTIAMVANGATAEGKNSKHLGLVSKGEHFSGDEVARKKVADILTNNDLYVETPALREEYDRGMEHYAKVLREGFSQQYRFTGHALATVGYHRNDIERTAAKVIHDLAPSEMTAPSQWAESSLFADPTKDKHRKGRKGGKVVETTDLGDDDDYPGVGPIPTHFTLRVFDLASHEFYWINAIDCERHVYDKTLRDKIILPDDQRNLLDILTTNLDDFTADVIEGKSAGNVVLCKGEPGVGKTLTAEVYSELIERPLYSIHSGNLGINAKDVREALEVVFKRALRWNAVLLLDEADVFVLERGSNISQNAIVAEFLRTLEYFTGLMFMTTNRANNIDDAILSRAAAIIDYKVPDIEDIRRIWEVQAANNGVTIPEDLIDEIVHGFERITPRDVKMLLRLALRVAKGNGHDLDIETIQRCAMFRGLHFEKGSRA